MKKSAVLFVIALLGILLFPIEAFAVDFAITETKIDAHLGEDGTVEVTESHTYEFDGKFNGITRSLIAKKGTSITDFSASENGTSLEIERDDETYDVFRSGKDETVTIELSYLIHDGVKAYEDMAEFYWPFFDSNNETDYDNLTIAIHPPKAAGDVIAYGFDEAYETETIESDGTVVFHMGLVDSGEKGDIRVAYDSSLFPAAAVKENKTIRDILIREEQELAEKQAAFLERQETLGNIAPYIMGAYGLFLLLIIFYSWRRKQTTKLEAERLLSSVSFIPKEMMSMPATIYYFRNFMAGFGELLTAGMMDLVRKGNIKTRENETSYLINDKTDSEHEALLIQLFFQKVGKNNTFSFDQLESYTANEENQESFHTDLVAYQKLLKEEVDSHHLLDRNVKQRLIIGILSVLLIPLIILFGIHQLIIWLLFSIIIMGTLLLFAFLYQPRTINGQLIKMQWQQFRDDFNELQTDRWNNLSEDDKERALIFSAGLKDKKLIEKNKNFIENDTFSQDHSAFNLLMLLSLSATANVSFGSASQVAADSVNTSSGSGTGVGGGGGGSGAF